MNSVLWRCVLVWMITCASVASVAAAPAAEVAGQTTATTSFKGRLVSDVLEELRRGGLKLVFSDALVTRAMRVTQEPRERAPRGIVTEILAEHGLALKEAARGALL